MIVTSIVREAEVEELEDLNSEEIKARNSNIKIHIFQITRLKIELEETHIVHQFVRMTRVLKRRVTGKKAITIVTVSKMMLMVTDILEDKEVVIIHILKTQK